MMKENNNKEELLFNEIKNVIQELNETLDFYGLEINEDGDIVDKKTKKLALCMLDGVYRRDDKNE